MGIEILLIKKFLYSILGCCGLYAAYLCHSARSRLGTAKLGNVLKGVGIHISKNFFTKNHTVIIAPTREGKTTSVFFPNLLENNLKGSIIVADPKRELYKKTHKYQELIGRRTILYDPFSMDVQYNPIKNCLNDREIIQLSQNLLINGSLSYELQTGKKSGGVEWLQSSQGLFTAALLYKKNISEALNLIIETDLLHLDNIFSNASRNIATQYNLFKTCLDSPKTAASIKNTLASNLQLFTDTLAINKSDFTAQQLRNEPIALYISYSENKSNYLSPLMACIYSQLIDQLTDIKGIPITFLLDELANIGFISNFPTVLSTCASRDMTFLLCLQSISQLEAIYGRYNTLTILNNCKTKAVLPSLTDLQTIEYISKLCGTTEVVIDKKRMSKTLFTPDEVRRIQDKKILVISNNDYIFLDDQNIYYEQQEYLKNTI